MNYQILPVKRYSIIKGGLGSGNFGHEGRPGEVGGSDGGGNGGEGRGVGTWGESLSTDEKDAVLEYTTSKYQSINQELRDGKVSTKNKATVEKIDSALEKSKLTSGGTMYEDQRLYRAASIPEVTAALNKGNAEGFTFTEKGYTSATTDRGIARNFQRSSDSRLFVIDAPAGTRAGRISSISNLAKEQEVLIARNTTYRIGKIESIKERIGYTALGGKTAYRTVKIDYVHISVVSQKGK